MCWLLELELLTPEPTLRHRRISRVTALLSLKEEGGAHATPPLTGRKTEAGRGPLGGLVDLSPVPEPQALGPSPAVLLQGVAVTAPGDVRCGVPRG